MAVSLEEPVNLLGAATGLEDAETATRKRPSALLRGSTGSGAVVKGQLQAPSP